MIDFYEYLYPEYTFYLTPDMSKEYTIYQSEFAKQVSGGWNYKDKSKEREELEREIKKYMRSNRV
jgi:hypothetical protein